MEFLTTGEKVKKLREQLKLKQEDLVSERVTRGLVSMIETGRREVTYKTAVKLAEKFNEKAEELNIILNIDEAYLMRSPKEDAEVYCLNKLKNDDITKNTIDGIFQVAKEYELIEVKAKAYSSLGEIYLKEKEFDVACDIYNKAKDIYVSMNKNEKLGYIYWRLGICSVKDLKCNTAIEYYQLSQYYCSEYNDIETKKSCLYNLANAYKRLNKIELALETINNFLLLYNEQENLQLYIQAQGIKANCYEAKADYDKAIEIYKSLPSKILNNENPILGYIYNNLGLNYCHKKDFEESKKYFEIAEKFRNKYDIINLGATLIEKSDIFLNQNLIDSAIKTIKIGLQYAEKYNDKEYLIKGNYMLADIYKKSNDNGNLERVYLEIVELLKDNKNKDKLRSIYDELVLIYLNRNEVNTSKKYLLLSINLD